MIERIGLALLRIGDQTIHIETCYVTYLHGDRVLGIVLLALDCQQARRQE